MAWLGFNQMTYPTFTSGRCVQKSALPFFERCLPESSFSTVGLLVLLLKWSYYSVRKGGVASPDSQLAARCLLESIIAATLMAPSGTLNLKLCDSWTAHWPRPDWCVGDPSFVRVSGASM